MLIYLEEQLNILYFLQEHRSPLIEPVLLFLNFLDSTTFYLLLTVFVWIGCSWKWGVRLAFLLLVNGITNYVMKEAFALPRPEVYDPTLPLVVVQGYGFPSGGAQGAFLLGGLLITYWKNRWAWILGGLFAFCVSFSRIYLGVHFPCDVIGGALFGLTLLALYTTFARPLERAVSWRPFPLLTLLFFSLSFLLSLEIPRMQFFAACGLVTTLGVFVSCRYHFYLSPSKTWQQSVTRGSFGILSSYAVLLLLKSWPLFATLTLGMWITLLASPVYTRFTSKAPYL